MGKRTTQRTFFGLLVALALVAAGMAYVLLFKPQNRAGAKTITIPKGVGISRITAILTEEGVITQAWSFKLASKALDYDHKLKAGRYRIPEDAGNLDILKILTAGKPLNVLVTIPEGVTARRIASILAKRVEVDSAAFMQVVSDSAIAHRQGIAANSLEGYLFPETYSFYWGIKPQAAAKAMVREFWRQLPDNAEERARELGRTLHEIVTLASLVEGEAMVDSERVIIAGVYTNRLKRGMRLQADPTIQYIIPDGPRRLLHKDLQIDSPYNTYLYAGLPPGPINNPGRKSIEAALYPRDVPYLYFVARGDGSHVFSVTMNQHLQAKRAFDRVRRRVKRKQ